MFAFIIAVIFVTIITGTIAGFFGAILSLLFGFLLSTEMPTVLITILFASFGTLLSLAVIPDLVAEYRSKKAMKKLGKDIKEMFRDFHV
jgi:uncharacterized membrane protein (DUF106 family)